MINSTYQYAREAIEKGRIHIRERRYLWDRWVVNLEDDIDRLELPNRLTIDFNIEEDKIYKVYYRRKNLINI